MAEQGYRQHAAVDITFQNINLTVKDRAAGTQKLILQGVSGECKSGRLFALMGPSGAGKTTLLDALAGNVVDGCKLEGTILVNGFPMRNSFKRRSCYVQQKDVLLSSATVREALACSAFLKLPRSMSKAEKRERVEAVLKELDLVGCANTLIGDEAIGLKGISGGQKRRVSVGIELVKDPAVMFLDEPTSGLDSEMANSVIQSLVQLARRQRTIVCTIHQPNSDITDCFDDFMLLAGGRVVFAGAWSDAIPAFAAQGYQCPTFKNPTDYFMSVIRSEQAVDRLVCANDKTAMACSLRPSIEVELPMLDGTTAQPCPANNEGGPPSGSTGPMRAVLQAQPPSVLQADHVSSRDVTLDMSVLLDADKAGGPAAGPPSCDTFVEEVEGTAPLNQGVPLPDQVGVLIVRNWRTWMRSPIMLTSELMQYVFVAVFIGLMYLNSFDLTVAEGGYNRVACIWFFFAILSFTPSYTAVTSWDRERQLLHRELSQKQYSLPAYHIARTAVMYPFEALQCMIFLLISYWFVGLQSKVHNFFVIFVVLFMFQIISEGIGLICAIVTRQATYAIILLTFVLLLVLSFSGFLISKVPVYFRWVHDVSYLTYAYAAVAKLEFGGLIFTDLNGDSVPGMAALPAGVNNELSVALNVGILACMTLFIEVAKLAAMFGAQRFNLL